MKKVLILLITSLLCATNLQAQEEILTNQSILDMVELGFTNDVILTKIKTSKNDFDTTINSLKLLKEKGTHADIIMEIMNADKKTNDLNVKKSDDDKVGIYIEKNGEFVKILPTAFSGTKTNTFVAGITYGIASSKIKSIINKAHSSNLALVTDSLSFYFHFAKAENNDFAKTNNNWWFTTAVSPNEFILVKLKVNESKNRRELNTGKVNIYSGSSIGINEGDMIEFDIQQLEDEHTFIVTPKYNLPEGEYCFFYQGTVPQGGVTNQSIFDFSVPKIESKYNVGDAVFVMLKDECTELRIYDIKKKKDAIYYKCYNRSPFLSESTAKLVEYHENECFSSKKELLNSLRIK